MTSPLAALTRHLLATKETLTKDDQKKALRLVVAIAFVVGLYSLHRLTKVKEEGEVDREEVWDELISGMTGPLRHVSLGGGMRRLAFMPLSAILGLWSEQDTSKDEIEGSR